MQKQKACCWPPATDLTKKARCNLLQRTSSSGGSSPLIRPSPAANPIRLTSRTGPSLSFFHRLSRNVKSATNTDVHVYLPCLSSLQAPLTLPSQRPCQRLRYRPTSLISKLDAWASVRSLLIHPTQLHAHLTGSISRECLHDIWETRKAQHRDLELEDPLVAIPTGKVDYDIKT